MDIINVEVRKNVFSSKNYGKSVIHRRTVLYNNNAIASHPLPYCDMYVLTHMCTVGGCGENLKDVKFKILTEESWTVDTYGDENSNPACHILTQILIFVLPTIEPLGMNRS